MAEHKSDLNAWTLNELQIELKRRKLYSHGLKESLIQRIKKDLVNDPNLAKNYRMPISANGDTYHKNEELKMQIHKEREERHNIVLWRKPLITVRFFLLESVILLQKEKENVLKHGKTFGTIALLILICATICMLEGSHQYYLDSVKKDILWCSYWVGLGILSSVGLGTGLHTFLLYLGPHIAKVTLAAWECGTLKFPEPPYPNEIICPTEITSDAVNILTIMSKVRLEAVMWGAGTAIGELPPYFMAKAARISGSDDIDNEDLEELEDLISSDSKDIFTRAKKAVPKIVEKVGFFGILLFASIPNPLFDLAGITCGHCLVPFWTFFGATLIGKAIIKMHIQQSFVILCFSKSYVESLLKFLGNIPRIGTYIQAPFKKAVQAQKNKLHQTGQDTAKEGANILGFIFEKLVTIMILYFVLSIVNSMAQSYAKRIDDAKRIVHTKTDKGE